MSWPDPPPGRIAWQGWFTSSDTSRLSPGPNTSPPASRPFSPTSRPRASRCPPAPRPSRSTPASSRPSAPASPRSAAPTSSCSTNSAACRRTPRAAVNVMLHRSLLDHVDLAPQRYHRLDPEAEDIAAMCAAYDVSMKPPLDLMVLGIGRNGHVGMNEPGTSPESATRRVELAPSTTQASVRYFGEGAALPTWGVTIGLSANSAARTIWNSWPPATARPTSSATCSSSGSRPRGRPRCCADTRTAGSSSMPPPPRSCRSACCRAADTHPAVKNRADERPGVHLAGDRRAASPDGRAVRPPRACAG